MPRRTSRASRRTAGGSSISPFWIAIRPTSGRRSSPRTGRSWKEPASAGCSGHRRSSRPSPARTPTPISSGSTVEVRFSLIDQGGVMATRTVSKTKSAKELAQESFDALKRKDIAYAERFWGPESVDHFLAAGEHRGKDAIAAYFRELFAAFPDFSLEVERIV